jgi:NAD-dependent deacetylase
VLFGENLPLEAFERARRAALECDVAMSLGTSSVVWPAAGIPLVAKEGGAIVIEVNPEATELTDHFDVSLRGPTGEILPRLLEAVLERRAAGEGRGRA